MLQALLEDRFKLQVHMEDRAVWAYTLIAVNPKLRKADPLSRTRCKEGPGPDGKDPRTANPVLIGVFIQFAAVTFIFYSFFFGLPIWLEEVRGFDAKTAGLLILPNTSHFAFLQDPALFNAALLHVLGDR